jgi:hypothetical protein
MGDRSSCLNPERQNRCTKPRHTEIRLKSGTYSASENCKTGMRDSEYTDSRSTRSEIKSTGVRLPPHGHYALARTADKSALHRKNHQDTEGKKSLGEVRARAAATKPRLETGSGSSREPRTTKQERNLDEPHRAEPRASGVKTERAEKRSRPSGKTKLLQDKCSLRKRWQQSLQAGNRNSKRDTGNLTRVHSERKGKEAGRKTRIRCAATRYRESK